MSTQPDQPPLPHYAVIFSNQRGEGDDDLYEETAVAMADLAAQQPGYISHESARDADGFGITISYWTDKEAIRAWKMNVDHLVAQQMGRDRFYQSFTLRIAQVDSIKTWKS